MKNRIIMLLAVMVIAIQGISAQAQVKKQLNPVGTWKFEAPAAPEGYNSGNIIVSITDKQHSAAITFTGTEYKIPADKVKFSGDSLTFSVYIEGGSVELFLRMESDTKMSGKAVTPDQEIPLTLTKEVPAKK